MFKIKFLLILRYPCSCRNVMPYCEIKGELLLTETRINFAADEKNYVYLMVFNKAIHLHNVYTVNLY